MVLDEHGCIVRDFWLEVPLHLVHAVTDARVVMPNHVHAIVRLLASLPACADAGKAARARIRPMVELALRGWVPLHEGP